jgi:Bacterial Ig-like domain (group 3)
VFPTSVRVGDPVVLVARVTPSSAGGTVQFKDGSTDVGDPQTVQSGFAARLVTDFPVGIRQLTASFIPNNPAAYQPSTSNLVQLTVRGHNP